MVNHTIGIHYHIVSFSSEADVNFLVYCTRGIDNHNYFRICLCILVVIGAINDNEDAGYEVHIHVCDKYYHYSILH